MTLAKKAFYLSSAVILAGAMGVAQSGMNTPQDQDSSRAGQAAGAQLRGCLSGSAGNYTLTDHSGTIYHLVGAESQLQGSVGHEVEITGAPDPQRSGASDDVASNTASSFQVTGAREVAGSCTQGSRTGTTGPDSHPMSEQPPIDKQPKGAPGEATPAPEPQPHLMAMLQQPGATDPSSTASQTSSTTSTTTTTTDTQTPASNSNGSMANTPVTSQTPAESTSPTGSNSQLGSGTANPSAVGTQPAQSNTTATPSAGANGTTATTPPTPGNPDAGTSAGAATATPNTSVSPSATTNPSATTATPGAAASPQSTQNDQNKPLYERQATDVPWASHSGSTSTTTSTNPNGSSSTTTTTTPQPEPHL